jgi:hypothetical protein
MGLSQRDDRDAAAASCSNGRGRTVALLGLALLVACGGRPAPDTQTTPRPHASARPDDATAGPAQQQPAAQPAGTAPAGNTATEAECQILLGHVIAIANAAHLRTVTPDLAPTEEQLADIRARMAPEFLPMCLSLDRAVVACQMRARSRDELLACMP